MLSTLSSACGEQQQVDGTATGTGTGTGTGATGVGASTEPETGTGTPTEPGTSTSTSTSTSTGTSTQGPGTDSTGETASPGALVDGEPFQLSGAGFGHKDPAAPILFDRFEAGGALGETLATPTIGPTWQLGWGNTIYDATRAFSGERAAMGDWTDAETSGNATFIGGLGLTEAYYSYRIYKEVYGGTDVNWNFKHGVLTSGDVDTYHGTVQLVSSELGPAEGKDAYTIAANGSEYNQTFYAADDTAYLPDDGWHRVEHYVRLSDPPGAPNGKRYFKVDGNGNFTYSGVPGGHYASPSGAIGHTTYDGDAMVTRTTDHRIENVFLPFYLRSGYSARAWYDEIYVDRTQARVEFGDQAEWAECTKRCPQPATSWSDEAITVTANMCDFAAGEVAFGFVVTANGAIVELGALGTW
ncbi:hypothetical protein [Nannocystis bainbridge]|uniref:Uncharacterized protein n=1 Tax=Nannocystis bainbridge TaxID=2995303 RepID=A0ABT5DU57_9BACT|nr:hypothetical protein [Nannocystis bainbridge]MDC0716253.1 hypothetical protein [Nannocystis bainbridge]